jgi:hypothetical protein
LWHRCGIPDRKEFVMSLYNLIGIVIAGVLMMLFAIGNRKKHTRRRFWEGAKNFAPRHRDRGPAPAA